MSTTQPTTKPDPEEFEQLLVPLHQAFLRASVIMAEIGPDDKRYWDILKAARELLDAMLHLGDAAFEWDSYLGKHEAWGDEEEKEEQQG